MNPTPSLEQLSQALTELLHAVNCTLDEEPELAQQRVRSAAALLRLTFSPNEAPANRPWQAQPLRGGLALWQKRILEAHIDTHLESNMRNRDLARLVNLSTCHFIRAFGESFGRPPHQYLLRKRLQRAQELMLSTLASLSDIALTCGLADQAHLTRQFRKIVGDSPGAWRRARRANTLPPTPSGSPANERLEIAPTAHAPRAARPERILA